MSQSARKIFGNGADQKNNKMTTIREHLKGSIGQALLTMCDGLEMTLDNPNYRVDMTKFNWINEEGVCYGCAATYCALKLTNSQLSNILYQREERARILNTSYKDIMEFEYAIDGARVGFLDPLILYMRTQPWPPPLPFSTRQDWNLNTDDWQRQLPQIRQFANEIIKKGF